MKNLLDKFLKMDRRYIFFLVALGVIIPLIVPIGLPVDITKPVKDVYDAIDSLPEGSYVIISLDYDPATIPELDPMAYAILRHCFRKNLKVITMTLLPAGPGVAEMATKTCAKLENKKYGEDYVFLGYKVGVSAVILGIGEDIRIPFPQDYYGTSIDDLPMMKGYKNYDDTEIVITISGTNVPASWVAYAHQRYHVNVASGVTAVMAADFYPYLQTGQMVGLIGGLKGAAEYEKLVGVPGKAFVGMDAQSIIHSLIIILIIIGNIAYFIVRKSKKEGVG
ncbi:MAG: hypothetical protein B6D57_00095 [Candidatus Coatesbacteria bacterium 4484_99]|uniref:Uncharacterized protein n=1 Tax=Candidatus Coatesbacteria bacterium 4484_99 TaxID=1970774 RepID=A0A1W9S409_9BACT|nr:MAG: hypothetical protein B6D57_00095 [Candidatus Coatesbacteria bacterium 4484_99]RLC42496.1 MAG: hypothetical protein DRH44_06270 [Candidatus Coatesbacteria bacterium]RLC42566.1 MAG: hypothetical protein DRH51_00485 [Candidatus Coatesbacteria bacterium]RLC42614.1 MAG: hypothetical protein DRH49_03525 [Candidatus Coatesbacteria bacterium]